MDASFEAIGRNIKQVQWRHHRALDSRLRKLGITLVQWDALRAINREPGETARRLAAGTFQSEQSFGVMATGMEANGLIVRSPGPGRRYQHYMTPEGERMLSVGHDVAAEVFSRSIGVLSDSERRALHELLGKILEQPSP
jgi:DNA-binding MarR family transcriptional regulator